MRKPLTVGVSVFLRKSSSIWNNGADQNCIFLLRLLKKVPGVGRVIAVNGGDGDNPPPGMMVGDLEIEWARPEQVMHEIDVIIEAGAQLSAENIDIVRKRGGKSISYKFGNAFIIDTERIIHNKDAGSIFNGSVFDVIWTHAQHVATCGAYWELNYRAPLRVVPHIWEPLFIDKAIGELRDGVEFGYKGDHTPDRVAVFEPNINIVKTCTIPILAIESAHRKRPGVIREGYITNSLEIKKHLTFEKFAENLDCVKDKIVSFEARYNIPWFLGKHADIVLAHQWENGLNYAYYDALYGEYPLIHNSDLLPKGIGYKYSGFDAKEAGELLIHVVEHHNEDLEGYRERIREFLGTVNATGEYAVEAHRQALSDLVGYPLGS